MKTTWIFALLAALVAAGCAGTPPPLKGSPQLLDFLCDGTTTKADAIAALGQPSGRFDGEKIVTYRLGYEPRNGGYYPVEREDRVSGWPAWHDASFSLVLIFDENSRLQKHTLVKVNR